MGETVPKQRFKSLGKRVASAVILLLICGIPVYLGGTAFLGLAIIFGALMLFEWMRMCDPQFSPLKFILAALALIVALLSVYTGNWAWAYGAIGLIVLVLLLLNAKHDNAVLLAVGTAYIIYACMAAVWLRGDGTASPERADAGLHIMIFVIITVIMADTFAYFGGSLIKGPKLAPRISPNKTWSGFFSGLLFASLVAGGFAYALGVPFFTGFLFGAMIAIASVFGDLIESSTKRYLGVKDSGTIIPGHGGILDRVDSLMLALIYTALTLFIFPQIWPPFAVA